MTKIHYHFCPVCGSGVIKPVASIKDHSVSGELFEVWECNACTFRFTQDVPDAHTIGPYYKSENYISHTNTSKGLVNRLYQTVRKGTLKQKRNLIIRETGLSEGDLLDVGSGTGAFAHTMKEAGWSVTAMEPDADARAVGKTEFNIELNDLAGFYTLANGKFDVITMWHVLEHVHDLQGYVAKLSLLLKEKGRLFVAVPNYTSKDAADYGTDWAAYDVPRHLYHFSPQSMQVLMEKHGLKIFGHKPMWFDSFYVSMLSSKYKHGRTNLIGAFSKGWSSNMKARTDVKKCSSVIYIIGK